MKTNKIVVASSEFQVTFSEAEAKCLLILGTLSEADISKLIAKSNNSHQSPAAIHSVLTELYFDMFRALGV